jgi:hypothetical protein
MSTDTRRTEAQQHHRRAKTGRDAPRSLQADFVDVIAQKVADSSAAKNCLLPADYTLENALRRMAALQYVRQGQ